MVVKSVAAGNVKKATASSVTMSLLTSTNQLVETDVQTIFIPIFPTQANGQACPNTTAPAYTLDGLRKVLFQEANPSGPTLGALYRRVSNGKTYNSAATSLVTDFARIGCTYTE